MNCHFFKKEKLACISKNWPKCNHFEHFCNHFLCWSYLQLHSNQFATIVVFILPYEQRLMWSSSKKKNFCPISCKCDQFSQNSMNIQRYILGILKGIINYILGFTNVTILHRYSRIIMNIKWPQYYGSTKCIL